MRFLIDAQLPPALAKWLLKKGLPAQTAKEAGLRDADDSAIWSYAIANDMTIVTKDEDFARLVAIDDGP